MTEGDSFREWQGARARRSWRIWRIWSVAGGFRPTVDSNGFETHCMMFELINFVCRAGIFRSREDAPFCPH